METRRVSEKLSEVLEDKTETRQFAERDSDIKLWHILAVALLEFGISVALLFWGGRLNQGVPILIMALSVLVAAALVYMIVRRFRDEKLAFEFQNAVFSSAMRKNNVFCNIFTRDGNIFYLDAVYSRIFKDSPVPSSNFQGVMENLRIPVEEREAIQRSLFAGGDYRVKLRIDLEDGNEEILLMIDPLPKPANYFMMSAYRLGEFELDSKKKS